MLVLSASTASALEAVTDQAARYLREHPGANLADVAYTYQVGRRIWPHRRVLVARTALAAAEALESRSPRLAFLVSEARERPVCFLFSGQGSQYAGMGEGLYRSELIFREQVDLCAEILAGPLDLDLRQVLFADADLTSTALAQPALFTVEYALAKLWMEWGVTPKAMLGHSVGEYVAACLAGVFTLEDALRLVAARGRLMQGLPGGAMIAVPLPSTEVECLLQGELALAAINGPSLCVVAGPDEAVAALRGDLAGRGVDCRRLHTSHAFHSSVVDPILEDFTSEVRRATLRPGSIPYISNVTGTWQTAEGATDPAYWTRHMRQTVLFGPGLDVLLQEPEAVLLEVGPGDALASLARRHPARKPEQRVVASMRHPSSRTADQDVALGALGHLWLAGVPVDWKGFHRDAKRQRLALPTYPFERQRYWVERGQASPMSPTVADAGRKSSVDDWLYVPDWTRSRLLFPTGRIGAKHRWLLLLDELGCGEELAMGLEAVGEEVVRVRAGQVWSPKGKTSFTIDPGMRSDYHRLVSELEAAGWFPDRLVHCWSLTETPAAQNRESSWFYGLLSLTEVFGRQSAAHPIDFTVVTNGTQSVSGDEALDPGKAALLGACKVIPQEYPDIRCRLIDIAVPPSGTPARSLLGERLLAELLQEEDSAAAVVAHRGGFRYVQTFRLLAAGGRAEAGDGLREGGVYLVTGGLGRIGMALAVDLARSRNAKLVLLGRSASPSRPLEGAEVLTLAADVADPEALRAAVAEARARFGAIHGVFHAAGRIEPGALGPIQNLEAGSCAALFRAKLGGLAALAEIFRDEPLDFLVAFSSLSTVLGGLGYAAYAAANACMDAFAHELSRASRIPCLAIDWDAWRFDADEPGTGMGARLSGLALSPEEGIAALKRILALGAGPQVIVSTSDLQARIDEWVNLLSLQQSAGEARHARPGLTTAYVAPRNELEEALVETWQELLGIEPVGVHDNFFDLGGHSLLGIQLNARLRRMFEVDVPLRALFDSPTVAELTEVVENALIGDIDELSDEEAELLLKAEPLLLNGDSQP